MKKMKRTVAIFFLMLTLLIQNVSVIAVNDSGTVDDSIEKLYAFGIVDVNFEAKEFITRGDMVNYAIRINGIDASMIKETSPFTDVAEDDVNKPYIDAAYHLGIISGISATEFSPLAPVTVEQASKIIINSICYSEIAEQRNLFEDGYYKDAVKLRFFKNVKADEQGRLSPDAVAKLLMNVLETDIDDFIKFGTMLSYGEGYKLLEKKLEIYRSVGVVEANSFTSIYGAEPTQKGYVEIGGKLYREAELNVSDYIGQNVEFYYRKDAALNEPEIVYITNKRYKNDIIRVDASDIESTDNYLFRYHTDENNSLTEKRLSKQTVCIYNKRQTAYSAELIKPDIGEVELIDNDNNGVIDVVIVNEYSLAVIRNVVEEENPVLLAENNDANLLQDMELENITVFKNGKSAKLNEIKKDDVALVMVIAALNGKNKGAYIYSSDNKVTGTVEAIGDEIVIIDGKEYESHIGYSEFPLGTEGTFYLDINQRIGKFSFEADKVYGFLKNYEKTNMGKINVMIFTENNRWVILELKDRIEYNGTKVGKEYFYNNVLPSYVGMITYRVNSEGKVCEINTPREINRWSDEYKTAIEQNIFRQAFAISDQHYRHYTASIGSNIPYAFFSAKTKAFLVPSISRDADPDDFNVINSSQLYSDERILGDIYIYDTDEFGNMDMCMFVGHTITANPDNEVALITKVRNSNINGGNYMITCMVDGVERNYYTQDTNITVPKVGSLVLFAYNSEGFVTSIVTKYDSALGFEQKGLLEGPHNARGTFKGQILESSSSEDKFILDFDYAQGPGIFTGSLKPKIYVYYPEYNEYKTGTFDDLVPGRYCFVKANTMRALSVIVFAE